MGNTLVFITTHARRLKNRYNAQYRAIDVISKENRPSAPRHPNTYTKEIAEDQSLFLELQKKDLNLDLYLKEVHIQSYDKIPLDSLGGRKNNERPLPESREPREKLTFIEPEEVEKGWCTLTHVSQFLVHHEEDPVKNSVAAIAKKYSLEEKKVENTLKYFSVFRVFDKVRDTIPRDYSGENKQTFLEGVKEVKAAAQQYLEHQKSKNEKKANAGGKQEDASSSVHGESSRLAEKAVKN